MTQPDSPERIIAEMRSLADALMRDCMETTSSSLEEFADRLAALAGAAPVACVHPDTLALMRETPRKWKRIGVEPPCELRTLEGYVNLYDHAPAKAREDWQPMETAPKDGRKILVAYPLFASGNNTMKPDRYKTVEAHWTGSGWDSGFWLLHEEPAAWCQFPEWPTYAAALATFAEGAGTSETLREAINREFSRPDVIGAAVGSRCVSEALDRAFSGEAKS